ncbi:MFS transporter [Noviherbaspirillum pedocola]|uniref:MFS transporter n=1 Tax=Noviherbaspirillum pedocola TaxID=2801341 RepID=A0A934T432_9BURK|nr:MFS transporter [Noviherbaspirillum pedocola]MBK4738503.1 MFS transporter [Noviherbaspirillum pedocola]
MHTRSINRWWTVVAGTIATIVGASSIATFMFGVFAKAIGNEYGWPRSSVSLGLTAFLIANGFGVLFIGAAIDRWGVRRTTGILIAIFGTAIATIGMASLSLPMFVATFAVIGFCGAAGTMIPYAVLVCKQFDQQRGLALGIVNAGNGVGGMLMPIIAQYLLLHYGWRAGYIGVGTIVGLVPLLCLIFLIRASSNETTQPTSSVSQVKESLWQVVGKRKQFWLLALAICLISFSTFGVMSQMVSILTDRGFTAVVAAGVLSVAGTSSMVARLGTGYLMDRIFAPYVMTIVFICAVAGIWFITHSPALSVVTFGAVLLGIGLGAEGDIITFVVSRYFPAPVFGRVMGAVWFTFAWGAAGGTYLLSLSYDLTKSYATAVYILFALIVVAIAAVLNLGPYIYPPSHPNRNVKLKPAAKNLGA